MNISIELISIIILGVDERIRSTIVLENVSNSIDLEDIRMIFESRRVLGKGVYEITSLTETGGVDLDHRNIILEYSNPTSIHKFKH
jgi:hypothetical protein